MTEEDKLLYCSFCKKSQHEVLALIAGPSSIFICEVCTDKCIAILDENVDMKLAERMRGQIDDGKSDFMPNLNSIIQQVQKID